MPITGYAQITPDMLTITKHRRLDNPPTLGPNGAKAYWVPVEELTVDTTTGNEITESRVKTIEAARVLTTITRRDMDAGELAAKDNGAVMSLSEIGSLDRAQFEFLFDHENRIRAVESRPPITRSQAANAIKSKLRS